MYIDIFDIREREQVREAKGGKKAAGGKFILFLKK